MSRKPLEVKRIPIGPLVAPATKEALSRLCKPGGVSVGQIIDEAIAVYEASLRPVNEPQSPQEDAVEIPALRGEALRSLRWWAKEDDVDFATVITQALAAYDDSRTAPTTSQIPSTLSEVITPLSGRRETPMERTLREKREREERARARSNVGDDPNYSFEDEYVGN